MKVGVFARQQVPTIEVDESIRSALWVMTEQHVHSLPVLDRGKVVGVVTDGGLYFRGLFRRSGAARLVRDLMDAKPVCCDAEDDIEDVAQRMLKLGIQRVLVIWPNGGALGEVSLGELAGGIGDYRLAERVLSEVFDRPQNGRPRVGLLRPWDPAERVVGKIE